jgi:hypothetical protein
MTFTDDFQRKRFIPDELVKKSHAIVRLAHKNHGYRSLPARISSKQNTIALACVAEGFTMLKAVTSSWKIRVFCWLAIAAVLIVGFVFNRWILLALIPAFLAERWLASYERNAWMVLAAILLSLEMLVDDFGGWGEAFPNARQKAAEVLGLMAGQTQTEWLDFYLPRRSDLDQSMLRNLGPR